MAQGLPSAEDAFGPPTAEEVFGAEEAKPASAGASASSGPMGSLDYIAQRIWHGISTAGHNLLQAGGPGGMETGDFGGTQQLGAYGRVEDTSVYPQPVEPKAPGPVSKALGGLAEGLVSNPLMTALDPLQSLAGAAAVGVTSSLTDNPWAQAGAALLTGNAVQAGRNAKGVTAAAKTAAQELAGKQAAAEAATASVAAARESLATVKDVTRGNLDTAKLLARGQHDQLVADAELTHQQTVEASAAVQAATVRAAQAQAAEHTTLADHAVESVAAAHSPVTTPQQAGQVVQQRARAWLDEDLPAAEGRLHDPVRAKLYTEAEPNGPVVPLEGVAQVAQQIAGRAGTLSQVSTALRGQGQSRVADLLNELTAARPRLDPLSGYTRMTAPAHVWDDVRALRSDIGEGMRDPKSPLQGLGADNLDRLYSALTEAMTGVAESHGAGLEWGRANAGSASLRNAASDHVLPIVKPGLVPGKAAEQLLTIGKTDGTQLQFLRDQAPEAADALAAHALRSGQYESLAPEAKAALVPNETHRAVLGGASVLREHAQLEAATVAERAAAEHAGNVAEARTKLELDKAEARQAAQDLVRTAGQDRASTVRTGQNALTAAQANEAAARALLPPGSQNSQLTPRELLLQHLVHKLGHAAAGALVGEVAGGMLPGGDLLTNHVLLPLATAGMTMAAPGMLRAGKALMTAPLTNPLGPAAAAVAGGNALSGGQ